jgi:hypothetical protein
MCPLRWDGRDLAQWASEDLERAAHPGRFRLFSFVSGYEFAGGGDGALPRSSFLFYVLGALGNFVVDLFDFSSQVILMRMLCVGLE